MPREKKDAKYLNIYIERGLYDDFAEFCKKYGYTKTSAAERALRSYIKDVEKKMEGSDTDAG